MHVTLHLAVSDIPLDELAEPGAPNRRTLDNPMCAAEGCGRERWSSHSHAGGGSPYCPRHARNYARNGYPEPRRDHYRDALFEAAHAYGDAPGMPRAEALCVAAAEYGCEVFAHRSEYAALRAYAANVAARHALTPDALALQSCAWEFTQHPAELGLDSFLEVQRALETAAIQFFRGLKPLGDVS